MTGDEFIYEYERWFVDNSYRILSRSWSDINPDCVMYQFSKGELTFGTGFVPDVLATSGRTPRELAEWAVTEVGPGGPAPAGASGASR